MRRRPPRRPGLTSLPTRPFRRQAVEKGNGSGAAAGISGSYVPPVPQTPSYESKPIKLRKPVSALEQNSWTRSLAKAAVSVGLAPDSWIVRDARDEMDEPVQLNTDPRLAEDFAAECKVFYSKANDGRAQRAAMLADGVVRRRTLLLLSPRGFGVGRARRSPRRRRPPVLSPPLSSRSPR